MLIMLGTSSTGFELPAEIHIGRSTRARSPPFTARVPVPGAIFDTADSLSRQAFEYAIAKVNTQAQIFARSKIVVHHIDTVGPYDSYSAYKMGKCRSMPSSGRTNSFSSLCAARARHRRSLHRSINAVARVHKFVNTTVTHSSVSLVARPADQSRVLHHQRLSALHGHRSSLQRSD